jgi:hypothetical protein
MSNSRKPTNPANESSEDKFGDFAESEFTPPAGMVALDELPTPMMLPSVLVEVMQERVRQTIERGYTAEYDDTHNTLTDFINHINSYTQIALVQQHYGSANSYRTAMIKIAALACAAVDANDRRARALQSS